MNRFLTQAVWDVEALNDHRLNWLQEDDAMHYSERGGIAIDDVLVDHSGTFIEDVVWFWDHAEDRHKIAHDYLIGNYVCPNGKHFALDYRRFRQRTLCDAVRETIESRSGGLASASYEENEYIRFKNHTVLF